MPLLLFLTLLSMGIFGFAFFKMKSKKHPYEISQWTTIMLFLQSILWSFFPNTLMAFFEAMLVLLAPAIIPGSLQQDLFYLVLYMVVLQVIGAVVYFGIEFLRPKRNQQEAPKGIKPNKLFYFTLPPYSLKKMGGYSVINGTPYMQVLCSIIMFAIVFCEGNNTFLFGIFATIFIHISGRHDSYSPRPRRALHTNAKSTISCNQLEEYIDDKQANNLPSPLADWDNDIFPPTEGADQRRDAIQDIKQKLNANKDLILITGNYNVFREPIFHVLKRHILLGEVIIILTDAHRNSRRFKEEKRWIKRNISDPEILVTQFAEIAHISEYAGETIVMGSVTDFLIHNKNMKRRCFEKAGLILTLNAEYSLQPGSFTSQALFAIINRTAPQPPQCLYLCQRNEDAIKALVRDDLHHDADTVIFHNSMTEQDKLCGWIFSAMPRNDYHYFKDMICSDITPETMLALHSLYCGAEKIYLSGISNLPWRTSLNKTQPTERYIKSPQRKLHYQGSAAIAEIEESCIRINTDWKNNLPLALEEVSQSATESLTTMVLCDDYLLRDYFLDNIALYTRHPFEPLMPIPTKQDRSNTAYLLVELLLAGEVKEDEIRKILDNIEDIESQELLIDQRLKNILNEYFGKAMNMAQYLTINDGYSQSKDKTTFTNMASYSLRTIEQETLPNHNYFSVETNSGEELDTVPAGLLYQSYAPGTPICRNGRMYIVSTIIAEDKKILVEENTSLKHTILRVCRSIFFFVKTEVFRSKAETINSSTVRRELIGADFIIKHHKTRCFNNSISFQPQEYKTIITPENNIPHRDYTNGRLLRITIENKKQTKGMEISHTLATLINELIPSLFPGKSPYVFATSSHPNANHEDDKISFGHIENIDAANPSGAKDSTSTIYVDIYEDSEFDLGLANTIFQNINKVFELIQDYLLWLLSEENTGRLNSSFLTYKRSTVWESLFLKETLDALNLLLLNTKQSRKGGISHQTATTDNRPLKCHSCYRRFNQAALHKTTPLVICNECARSTDTSDQGIAKRIAALTSFLVDSYAESCQLSEVEIVDKTKFNKQLAQVKKNIDDNYIINGLVVGFIINGSATIMDGLSGPIYDRILLRFIIHSWQKSFLSHEDVVHNTLSEVLTVGHKLWIEAHLLDRDGFSVSQHFKVLLADEQNAYDSFVTTMDRHHSSDPFIAFRKEFDDKFKSQ
ncbi:MAG: hypothetical protein ACNI27_13200 [Desulfovibrio sp.]